MAPDIYTRVPGATGQTAADYRPYVFPSDDFNTAPFNYSQTPNERTSLWLLGSRPLGESMNFFMEGFVHQRNSEQQAAPELTYGDRVDIPADNYYNPFGVVLEFRAGSSRPEAQCQRRRRSLARAHRVGRRCRSLDMEVRGR